VTELQLTLAACAAGLVLAPFAWRRALGRPALPPPPARTSDAPDWRMPLGCGLLVLAVPLGSLVVQQRAAQPGLALGLLAAAVAATAGSAALLAPRLVRPALRAAPALGTGVLVGIAAMPFTYGVLALESLALDTRAPQEAVRLLQEQQPGWVAMAAYAVVLAPLAEELLFRVILWGALRRFATPTIALVASAALFGSIHYDPPTTILPMFVFGLILARLLERTGSYLACVAAHATFNAFGVIAALVV